MKVLVLGGGQFQGRKAVERLVRGGHEVTTYHRGVHSVAGSTHIQGLRSDLDLFSSVIRKGRYDGVIDNIAYQADDIGVLLPILKGAVGHYIFISSFVVYGRQCRRGLLREEEADLLSLQGGDYDVGKRQCEQVLRASSLDVPWTILRFSNIDGVGDQSNRRGFFIDRVRDGGGLLIPSDFAEPFRPLWLDDAAQAVVRSVGNTIAYNKTYNITGSEILTLREWLTQIAALLGVPEPYMVQYPLEDIRKLLGFPYRVPLPMRPLQDISRAQQDLGYKPTPVASWLPQTVEWWCNSGLTSVFWEYRQKEIEGINKCRAVLGKYDSF